MPSAPNTPVTYYIDNADVKRDCKQDFQKIDKACEKETDRSPKNKHPVLRKMLGDKPVAALDRMATKIKGGKFQDTADTGWMSHCDGLWVKPSSSINEDLLEFNSMLKDMSKDVSKAVESQVKPLVEKVTQEIKDKAIAEAKEKAVKAGIRGGARWGVGLSGAAVGGVGAIVTETIATAWNIYDWGKTGYQAATMGVEAYGAIKEIGTVLNIAETASRELSALGDNIANKTPTDLMADGMGVLSRLDPCTRARRCMLVPYDKTQTATSLGGSGCCPGQTGHHVLPDEMTKNGNCPGYEHGEAPTVCVEGANGSNGSHGRIHRNMSERIRRHTRGLFGNPDAISYTKARDLGIRSMEDTFPESKCDSKCLRAQLDAYYKKKCTKPLPPLAGVAKPKSKRSAEQ